MQDHQQQREPSPASEPREVVIDGARVRLFFHRGKVRIELHRVPADAWNNIPRQAREFEAGQRRATWKDLTPCEDSVAFRAHHTNGEGA
jgi:hypothetical protein